MCYPLNIWKEEKREEKIKWELWKWNSWVKKEREEERWNLITLEEGEFFSTVDEDEDDEEKEEEEECLSSSEEVE